jgi:hypothetical protein
MPHSPASAARQTSEIPRLSAVSFAAATCRPDPWSTTDRPKPPMRRRCDVAGHTMDGNDGLTRLAPGNDCEPLTLASAWSPTDG